MQDCFQPQYKQVIFRLPHFKTHLDPEMLPSHIESQPPAVLLEMSTWEPAQPHAVPVQGQIYGKYMGNIQEYHGNIKYMGYSIYIHTYHDRDLRPFHIPEKKKSTRAASNARKQDGIIPMTSHKKQPCFLLKSTDSLMESPFAGGSTLLPCSSHQTSWYSIAGSSFLNILGSQVLRYPHFSNVQNPLAW